MLPIRSSPILDPSTHSIHPDVHSINPLQTSAICHSFSPEGNDQEFRAGPSWCRREISHLVRGTNSISISIHSKGQGSPILESLHILTLQFLTQRSDPSENWTMQKTVVSYPRRVDPRFISPWHHVIYAFMAADKDFISLTSRKGLVIVGMFTDPWLLSVGLWLVVSSGFNRILKK